jgi:hypothetical protein
MSKQTICVDCRTSGPEADTRYTLIGSGWRVTRRETPEGTVVDWRCCNCWREFKRVGQASGEFAAASSGRIRVAGGHRS